MNPGLVFQLPFLLRLPILEKLAPSIALILIGQTGPQLFVADGNGSESPLLIRMASDCEDVKFISSLAAFRSRTLYDNVSYDHMVGWRTSSIRRETKLVEVTLTPEEMISGLQRVGWKKVDVSFHSAVWPFFARNNIHVKHEGINNAGAGIICHVVDNLKEQESRSFIIVNMGT